jgi:pyruvate dehydrogenase E2 component (dihydrolipoamide acetyltransferase)
VKTARRLAATSLVAFALVAVLVAVPFWKPAWVVATVRAAAFWRVGVRAGHVDVRGVRIGWAELGHGPPVVMVHGLGGESLSLLPLARELAAQGRRAVMIDLPGYGRSAPAPTPLQIDEAGEYVLDAARRLGAGPRPALLGHSLGGWIVAWQALERPERCGPVILTAPAGSAFEPPPLNILMPRTVDEGRRNIQLLFADPPYLPAPVIWVIVHRPRPVNLDLLRSAVSGRFLLDGLLPGMSVPALIVSGAHDRVAPPETGERMAKAIPGARYLVVEGAGHMLVWEKPAEIAAAVDEFLRQAQSSP